MRRDRQIAKRKKLAEDKKKSFLDMRKYYKKIADENDMSEHASMLQSVKPLEEKTYPQGGEYTGVFKNYKNLKERI